MTRDAYPHVNEIEDEAMQRTMRLLWDEIHRCEKILAAKQKLQGTVGSAFKPLDGIRRRTARIAATPR